MNILIGIVLLFVILPFIVVYANTHPPRYPLNVPPSIYQAAYEPVSFSTADGIILAEGALGYPRRGPRRHARSRGQRLQEAGGGVLRKKYEII